MLEQLEVSVVGTGKVAGRPVVRAEATPLASRGRARLALREAGLGASSYEIAVDVERGVLLSVEARIGSRPFQRCEVTQIEFDGQLPPSLFSPEESSGAQFVKDRAPEHLSLDALVDAVDFPVLVPDPSPSPYPPYIALFDSDRRGFGPRHAVFTYAIVDPDLGRGQLRVTLAGSELGRRDRERWESVGGFEVLEERHGRVARRRARAVLGGAYVELESAVYPTQRLIDLVRSLRRYLPGQTPQVEGAPAE